MCISYLICVSNLSPGPGEFLTVANTNISLAIWGGWRPEQACLRRQVSRAEGFCATEFRYITNYTIALSYMYYVIVSLVDELDMFLNVTENWQSRERALCRGSDTACGIRELGQGADACTQSPGRLHGWGKASVCLTFRQSTQCFLSSFRLKYVV